MSAIDTLEIAKKLRQVKLPKAQAETLAEILKEREEKGIAVGGDLRELEHRLKLHGWALALALYGAIIATMKYLGS